MIELFAAGPAWMAPAMALGAGVMSYGAVAAVRRYALRHGVVDHPNVRSSHVAPTPRGGGLGVVATIVVAAPLCGRLLGVPPLVTVLSMIAAVAVAIVGWLDDRAAMAVGPRIVVHLAAGIVIAAIGVASGASGPVPLPIAGVAAWWLVWTVSAINVVNFMDGIDGLIASQMLLYGIYVAWSAPEHSAVAPLGAVFAGASAGFLAWNWSPARIFLGDVGSGFYGIAAVVLGMALLHAGGHSVARAYLPLAPLFGDATITLLRRASRGERIWSAHREHLYQRLANGPWTHARTALVYLAAAAVGAGVGSIATTSGFIYASIAYGTALLVVGVTLDRLARNHVTALHRRGR